MLYVVRELALDQSENTIQPERILYTEYTLGTSSFIQILSTYLCHKVCSVHDDLSLYNCLLINGGNQIKAE